MKITALIVDDEPLAREWLQKLLVDWPQVELLGQVGSGGEALEFLGRRPVDLLFLDIQMPEIDGFDLLEAIGVKDAPLVIFVTAFDEHALRAFEVHALDYLLKPVRPERFAEALRHAFEILGSREHENLEERLEALLLERAVHSRKLERLLVRSSSGAAVFVRSEQIEWAEAAGNYVLLHVAEQSYVLRLALQSLEQRLDPGRFIRIHRGTIVNLESIKELHPWFHGEFVAVLKSGRKLAVSRRCRRQLRRVFGVTGD